MKEKKFETLLKSEVKKVVKAANEYSGRTDCELVSYTYRIDPNLPSFVEVKCDIGYDLEDYDGDPFYVQLSVFLPDRRHSFAVAFTM
jgi:hypothetical protein